MAGEITQGRRMPDVPIGEVLRISPGDYARRESADGWEWRVRAPNGSGGYLGDEHEVEEHDDRTITVTPSILTSAGPRFPSWHGYLKRGVWRSC